MGLAAADFHDAGGALGDAGDFSGECANLGGGGVFGEVFHWKKELI